jgi:hypothetical protein
MGIGEGVMVRALDRNALRRSGDGLAALAAKDVFFFFGRLFFGFLFGQLRRVLAAFFPGPLTK